MSYLTIDGAQGEGGGQVLRTALTLSMLCQRNIEVINIRANRKKPGLMRQHLTSVKAAAEICNAKTEGLSLHSNSIKFCPNKVKAGKYHFAIGTAGSTVLVCQTILLALANADEASSVTFEGGTHNGMSPSLSFLQNAYLPILKLMGIDCQVKVTSLGFYPAGGGSWQLEIWPCKKLKTIELMNAPQINEETLSFKAIVSNLSDTIGHREIEAAKKALKWDQCMYLREEVESVASPGPGNSFQISIDNKSHNSVFEVVGEVGISAERVAKRATGRVKQFIQAKVAVETHLADQLLLPMTIAGSGKFTSTKPSLHTITNIDVIKQFIDIDIDLKNLENGQAFEIEIKEKK